MAGDDAQATRRLMISKECPDGSNTVPPASVTMMAAAAQSHGPPKPIS